MPEYRYTLEKGSKKYICPECGGKRWVRYIDTQTGNYLPERYGRCDKGDGHYFVNPYSDGYAKAIQEQERGNRSEFPNNWKPKRKKAIPQPTPEPVHFDLETYKIAQAPTRYAKNVFLQNLIHRVPFPFLPTQVDEVAQLYQLGTIVQGYMAGAVTLPFIDTAGNIRAVQVKQFDETNHTTRTSFLHSIIERHYTQQGRKLPGWLKAYTKQDKRITCLFGAHLLRQYPNNPIALVEAPKTAVYGALYFGMPQSDKDLIWLAVYNKSSFSFDKIKVLKGRTAFVFPDLSTDGSTFKEWERKAKEYERRLPGTRFVFSDLLEQLAPEQDREEGSDLADYLIRLNWRIFRQPATTATEPHKPQPEEEHQTAPTPAPATTPQVRTPAPAVPAPGPEGCTRTTTPATTTQVRRTAPAPTATPTATPAPTAAPETREQLTPIHTAHPAATPVMPERLTENKKAKSQDATQPDQTDMIIEGRRDYSEAQIIQAIERISPAVNAKQTLRTWINEGTLHRCKATNVIFYVPF